MHDYAISLENVSKIFQLNKGQSIFEKLRDKQQNFKSPAKLIALDHLTFKVSKGEILAIIGLNGGGKTTLLRIISGIYQPDSGSVKVNGKLAPMLHVGIGFQQELAASENIINYGLLLGMSKSEIVEKINHIIEFAELEKFSRMKLKHYSSGMRMSIKKIGIGKKSNVMLGVKLRMGNNATNTAISTIVVSVMEPTDVTR